MTTEFESLINLSQTGSLKKEVVNYDEQTLKDALEYLTSRDMKPTLQRWIRTELATRSRVRGDTRYSKGFACTSWAVNWCKEWDEARTNLNPNARWYDKEEGEQHEETIDNPAVANDTGENASPDHKHGTIQVDRLLPL